MNHHDSAATPLTRPFLLMLACACGIAVSNLYYSQPLLEQIRVNLNVSAGSAGLVSTCTQVGYTLGLLFLVLLGDALHRRKLIVGLMVIEALFLAGAALAPSLGWLQFASLGIGIATVSAQVIVPLVAQLSEPKTRGQNVGTVMSGLLLGILLARVVAGAVGGTWGWRALFWFACGLSLLLALVLHHALPDMAPTAQLRFRDLIRSLWGLIKEEPRLRESALVGGLIFASFMVFWTSLSFHLEGPPFSYSTQTVGLFGFVGAAGALAAPFAGKSSDARGPRAVIGFSTALTALSFVLFWVFGFNVWGIIVGVLLMDAGVQATHISNQARILALRPEARSRLNTVYMVAYFTGGSLGSLSSSIAWSRSGWQGVCLAGLLFSSGAFVVHGAYARRQ
ncbi:putative transporter [Abditibacteriota bacterium]|nr:putative transporter [Abditibacteriota bacterium]